MFYKPPIPLLTAVNKIHNFIFWSLFYVHILRKMFLEYNTDFCSLGRVTPEPFIKSVNSDMINSVNNEQWAYFLTGIE